MCLGEKINKICGETGTEAFTESAAVSLLSLDEILVYFPNRSLEGVSVDSGF